MLRPLYFTLVSLLLRSTTFVISLTALAQNLIPNGSFEDILTCPEERAQLFLAPPWRTFHSYGSLFSECSSNDTLTPPTVNCCGFFVGTNLYPADGSNFGGFSNYTDFPNQGVEYMIVPLARELRAGETFVASAMLAPDVGPALLAYSYAFTNAIGLGLVGDTTGLNEFNVRNRARAVAQLAQPLADTATWTPLRGCATALGGERYLVVGNFLEEKDVLKVYSQEEKTFARNYIFVDDVRLEVYDPYPDTILLCNNDELEPYSTSFRNFQITTSPCSDQISTACAPSPFQQIAVAAHDGCRLADTTVVYSLAAEQTVLETSLLFCMNEQVVLQPPIPGAVQWPDGSSNREFLVKEPGRYRATIRNTCGDFDVTYDIELGDCGCDYVAPNAFSPNGDGTNDWLNVFTSCIYPTLDFNMQVYDRWGGLLYEATDPLSPPNWDGTTNGQPADVGVYVFLLRYAVILPDGSRTSRSFSSSVHLIR